MSSRDIQDTRDEGIPGMQCQAGMLGLVDETEYDLGQFQMSKDCKKSSVYRVTSYKIMRNYMCEAHFQKAEPMLSEKVVVEKYVPSPVVSQVEVLDYEPTELPKPVELELEHTPLSNYADWLSVVDPKEERRLLKEISDKLLATATDEATIQKLIITKEEEASLRLKFLYAMSFFLKTILDVSSLKTDGWGCCFVLTVDHYCTQRGGYPVSGVRHGGKDYTRENMLGVMYRENRRSKFKSYLRLMELDTQKKCSPGYTRALGLMDKMELCSEKNEGKRYLDVSGLKEDGTGCKEVFLDIKVVKDLRNDMCNVLGKPEPGRPFYSDRYRYGGQFPYNWCCETLQQVKNFMNVIMPAVEM